MSIHKIIREGRARLRLTEQEFAERVGVSRGAVQQWEKEGGTAPRRINQPRVAAVLGISVAELMGGAEPQAEEIDLDAHPDLVRVRAVKMRLQAGVTGFSLEGDQADGQPIFFRADWLRDRGYKPYNLIAIKIQGASMEPTLHPGDMVVINTADTDPKDGKPFAVNYEGEALIKRMQRDGGAWWLSSDNPDQRRFPRKECVEGSCVIIGRVIHRQSEEF